MWVAAGGKRSRTGKRPLRGSCLRSRLKGAVGRHAMVVEHPSVFACGKSTSATRQEPPCGRLLACTRLRAQPWKGRLARPFSGRSPAALAPHRCGAVRHTTTRAKPGSHHAGISPAVMDRRSHIARRRYFTALPGSWVADFTSPAGDISPPRQGPWAGHGTKKAAL